MEKVKVAPTSNDKNHPSQNIQPKKKRKVK